MNLSEESYQAIFLFNLPVKSRENKTIFPFIGVFVKFQGFIQIWFVTKQELEDIKKVEYDDSGEQSEDEYNEPLELYEGQVFKTAEEAYITVETFAYSHGFGIRKGHVEKDPNRYKISRTFLYCHARKPLTEKKSHKTEASGLCQTDCKWKSQKLTDEILKEIEYYTLVGKLNASAQYRLLSGKYQVSIHHQPEWDSFIKDFYKTRNILDQQTFEICFKNLLKHYPKAAQYLNKALYSDRHSWARAYTFCHFTASIQATSHVESINSHIKLEIINPNIKPPNICDTMYMNIDAILKAFVALNIIEKIYYEINHSLFYHTFKISPESLYLYQIQDDNTMFIDDAFDYPLAHFFFLFKQLEEKIVEIWEVIHITWKHSKLHVFLFKDGLFICSCMLLINRRYPCKHFFRVMVYSLAAKFFINFVVSCWLCDEYQDKDLSAQPLVSLLTVFLSKPAEELLIPTTILQTNDSASLFLATSEISSLAHSSPAAKKSMQKKKVYAEIIGIARKAINIAIEKDDSCILKFLKKYIVKNEHSLVENTATCGLGTNTCSKCDGKGHNHRWHLKHKNRVYDSSIICEIYNGHSHRKEQHNINSIEANEFDQAA
ncbi:24209_t:CDS:10, partial [Cetraspora pellucida]